jgi:hypothetical protein
MSLIPNKNLFIVTSALNANIGVVNEEDRLDQTIASLISLRTHVPNALIIFTDGSPREVPQSSFDKIQPYVNLILSWSKDEEVRYFAEQGRKSEAEILLLSKTLRVIKSNPEIMKIMHGVKRIFKYSARTVLTEDFDISVYDNMFGKYVFKKSLPSWLSEDKKKSITDHLYITRMYSFCPSLLDNYMMTQQSIFNDVVNFSIDTEHAHYKCLDKKYVVEFDKLYCNGIVAGSGELEKY